MQNPGNRVMYYLADGPDRAFVSEELMLICWFSIERWGGGGGGGRGAP